MMKRAASGRSTRQSKPIAPRDGRPRSRRVAAKRGAVRLGPSAGDLVIVSRALAELGSFLQHRQASTGRGHVVLDRRVVERRRAGHAVEQDRRRSDRRRPSSDPTEALMRVLGFIIVPSAASPAGSSNNRHAKHAGRAALPPERPHQIARRRRS
jgi:hypothetical protein